MTAGCLFLLGLVLGVASKAHVFQGSCDDDSVLCAQLCLRLNEDTYECGCWNDHELLPDGVGCRLNTTLSPIWHSAEEFPDSSEEYSEDDETAPVAFYGSNYAEFPVVESAYLETNITIEFKLSAQRDGILFFAGQFKGNDFISLALIGPNIMLRQDCGEGTIEDLYRGPFSIGIWHNVSIIRHYCYLTEVQADGRQPMKDEAVQFQNFKGITMDEGIFVGGAPRNVHFLDSKAGTDRGITGCIRKIVVNGEVLLHTEEQVNKAVNQKHLEKCGVERKERIAKLEDVSKEDQFMEFDIATGFEAEVNALMGPKKTRRTSTTTTTEAPTTTTPVVPPEPEEHLSSAFFSGSQTLSWPAPADLTDYLELSVRFKPKAAAGVIFFWQDGSRHVAVYLRQGYVLVDVNMGADSLLLRSAEAVGLNSWHKLELWRSGRGLLLKVDHQTWIEGELQALTSEGITEGGQLYLGGVEATPPAHLQGLTGFHGCVQHLRLNGRNMKMTARKGIVECSSATDPCASADCPKSCAVIDDSPVCLCEFPSYGPTCQSHSQSTVGAINFQGHSYLELQGEKTLSEITGDKLHFSMHLKVENMTGESMLLAFAGDHLKADADFFRLKLVPGYIVKMEMNLGSGAVDLAHPTPLQPGKWHIVTVVREKKHVTLSIDGLLPISTVSPGPSEQLNVYSSLYIGGLPTSSAGFHGCVASVDIGNVSITQPSHASSAINVRGCAN